MIAASIRLLFTLALLAWAYLKGRHDLVFAMAVLLAMADGVLDGIASWYRKAYRAERETLAAYRGLLRDAVAPQQSNARAREAVKAAESAPWN